MEVGLFFRERRGNGGRIRDRGMMRTVNEMGEMEGAGDVGVVLAEVVRLRLEQGVGNGPVHGGGRAARAGREGKNKGAGVKRGLGWTC